MLTRKQIWRRVRPGGGRFVDPTPTPTPTPPPRSAFWERQTPSAPIDSLRVGDSLLQLLGKSAARGTEDSSEEETQNEAPVDEAERDQATAAAVAVSPKTVSFKSQVRVVLVPCRRELHSLNAQLWWGADDYGDFR